MFDQRKQQALQDVETEFVALERAISAADAAWLDTEKQHAARDRERWEAERAEMEKAAQMEAEKARLLTLHLQNGGTKEGFERLWPEYRERRALDKALQTIAQAGRRGRSEI